MSVLKSQVRLSTLKDVGVLLSGQKAEVENKIQRSAGAIEAFLVAAKSVEGVMAVVDQDIDSGELELVEAGKVKKYLTRAVMGLKDKHRQAKREVAILGGRVSGLDKALEIVEKRHKVEEGKLALLQHAEESGGDGEVVELPHRRAVGTRPLPTIKQRRLAEATAGVAAVSEDTDVTSEEVAE